MIEFSWGFKFVKSYNSSFCINLGSRQKPHLLHSSSFSDRHVTKLQPKCHKCHSRHTSTGGLFWRQAPRVVTRAALRRSEAPRVLRSGAGRPGGQPVPNRPGHRTDNSRTYLSKQQSWTWLETAKQILLRFVRKLVPPGVITKSPMNASTWETKGWKIATGPWDATEAKKKTDSNSHKLTVKTTVSKQSMCSRCRRPLPRRGVNMNIRAVIEVIWNHSDSNIILCLTVWSHMFTQKHTWICLLPPSSLATIASVAGNWHSPKLLLLSQLMQIWDKHW